VGFSRLHGVVFGGWWLLSLCPVVLLCHRRTLWTVVLVALAGCVLGLQRGGAMQHKLQGYRQLYGQTVLLSGRINDDPAYDKHRNLDFRVSQVRMNGQKLPGEVRIKLTGGRGLARGDTVQVRGKLRPGFGNYQAAMSFASVVSYKRSAQPIEQFRHRFFSGVYNALPDPQASLGLGFLIGLRSQLPDTLQDQLRSLALTHIVVASGYNLTILVRVTRRILAHSSKFQALTGSIILVGTMMMVTGMSPSMTRAGLVTLVTLGLWYMGRKLHPVLLLLGGAASTAAWNPLYLWSDLGWWLSFLAFAGVLLVGPLLTCRCFGERAPPLLAQVALETIAAQLVVEPLIMVVFGQFSVLGLLANILVVPCIPLAMLGTFVAGLAGLWWPTVAAWFGLPAKWVIGYIVEVVEWLASMPWAVAKISLAPLGLAVFYVLLITVCVMLWHKTGYRFFKGASVIE